VLVLRQPEIEIAVRIEALNWLTQKALKAAKKLIDLGQLFSGVSEKVLDPQFRMMLAHEHRQGGAVSSSRKP
jgi:hypothetical protein